MNSQAIFDAINDSQDNSPLRRWILRNRPHDLHWSFTDALNALLVFAWRDAEDADELEGHLMYAQRQIAAALLSVQREIDPLTQEDAENR